MLTEQTEIIGEDRLEMTRVFRTSPETLFRAMTERDRYAQWACPQSMTIAECELDARVGGSFRTVMHGEMGDHTVVGTFRAVEPPSRIQYTWAWLDEDGNPGHEALVTIMLEQDGDVTALHLVHENLESREAAEQHSEGWASSLTNLAERLLDQAA